MSSRTMNARWATAVIAAVLAGTFHHVEWAGAQGRITLDYDLVGTYFDPGRSEVSAVRPNHLDVTDWIQRHLPQTGQLVLWLV